MDSILSNAASLSVILGFVGGVFSYVILRPLNKAIENLNKAVGELRMELLTTEGRRHDLEIEVAKIRESTRSAHHRMDEHLKLHHGYGGGLDEGLEHR